jgi:hypothetical protein
LTTETACWWLLHVDLTGSKLGPAWRSVDLQLDPVDWPTERIRAEAAAHYAVPLEQVGEPQFFREPHIPDPPTREELFTDG